MLVIVFVIVYSGAGRVRYGGIRERNVRCCYSCNNAQVWLRGGRNLLVCVVLCCGDGAGLGIVCAVAIWRTVVGTHRHECLWVGLDDFQICFSGKSIAWRKYLI